MIKRFAMLIVAFFIVFGVEASMISFLVIETGVPQEGRTLQHSLLWENTLLDVFFNAGHIVSNAPIQRLEAKPSADFLQSSALEMEREAIDGGVDYIVLAQLDYFSDSAPAEISFLIYRVRGRVKVLERRITGKSYRSTGDELDDMKIIIGELVPYFNNR